MDSVEETLRRLSAKLEAAELELERAHHLLDQWGLPREIESEEDGSHTELSLTGRLELLPDGELDFDELDDDERGA